MTSTEQHWDSFSRTCRRAAGAALALGILFLSAVVTTPPAQAQAHTGFTVLYSLKDGDGSYPYAGLALDGAGNVYGATTQGGDTSSSGVLAQDCFVDRDGKPYLTSDEREMLIPVEDGGGTCTACWVLLCPSDKQAYS